MSKRNRDKRCHKISEHGGKSRICLCCIVKDDSEAHLFERMLASFMPYVNGLAVAITGLSGQHERLCHLIESYRGRYIVATPHTHSQLYAEDEEGLFFANFAEAKNLSFELADSLGRFDWLCTADADDILQNGDELQEVAIYARDVARAPSVLFPYWYQVRPTSPCIVDRNQVVLELHPPRLLRPHCFEWQDRVNEHLVPLDRQGKQKEPLLHTYNPQEGRKCAWIHFPDKVGVPELEGLASIQRNLRLLEFCHREEQAQGIRSLHTFFYLGWAYHYAKKFTLAEQFCVEYLIEVDRRGGDDPNRVAETFQRLADIYLAQDRMEKALDASQRAVAIAPNSPLLGLALSEQYIRTGKYAEAAAELERVMQMDTASSRNSANSPFVIKQKIAKLTQAISHQSRTWGANEICYYASFGTKHCEQWSPRSLEEGGIGGSETAVLELARQWAKKGWRVTVFCDCGPDAGDHEGVNYRPYYEMNWQDSFNILILWRSPGLLEQPIKARYIFLDLHDGITPSGWNASHTSKVDRVFFKSRFHRELLLAIPESKTAIISNGPSTWHLAYLHARENRHHKLFFGSNYERGLELLLSLWPHIRERFHDATLDICYGWNFFDQVNANNPPAREWKARISEQMHQDGITHHGRIGKKELAKVRSQCGIWAYPTHFSEINCITALESQADGLVPVTMRLAALEESVASGIKISGDIRLPDVQQAWLDALFCIMDDENTWREESDRAKAFGCQFSWEKIADEWTAFFS